jgi:hypothetical protein
MWSSVLLEVRQFYRFEETTEASFLGDMADATWTIAFLQILIYVLFVIIFP